MGPLLRSICLCSFPSVVCVDELGLLRASGR